MSVKELKELAKRYKVLYVEDEEILRDSVLTYLRKLFKLVDGAENGYKGLKLYKNNQYDLVITDIAMPKMNGLEMAKKIKKINPNQNILIISAYTEVSYFVDSIKIGIDGYIIKPIDYDQMNLILYKIVYKITEFKTSEQCRINLEKMVELKTKESRHLQLEKIRNYKKTLKALVNMIESRDPYTGGHSQRVAKYSSMIAKEMGFDKFQCETIYQTGILHDIGKIAIPDSILLKPGKLGEIEYKLIQKHVEIGYDVLVQVPMFKELANIIKYHHERFDGSGYPNGIKGNEIPVFAQIMAVADTFDAMTTSRIYKSRKSVKEALAELKELKGKHFAKNVVESALKVLDHVDISKYISQLPSTELEKERFSYFYKDQISEVYNKDYLDLNLIKNTFDKNYNCLYVFYLQNFGHYNKSRSWEAGDVFLKIFGNFLQATFPDNMIFRIHGDDFVLLREDYIVIDINTLKLPKIFEDSCVKLSLQYYNIEDCAINSFDRLEKLL